MTNPYQPPQDRIRFAPFHKRLARGIQLAVAEYNRGLRREKLSPTRHLLSWLAMMLILLVLVAWLTGISVGVYNYIRTSGFNGKPF